MRGEVRGEREMRKGWDVLLAAYLAVRERGDVGGGRRGMGMGWGERRGGVRGR